MSWVVRSRRQLSHHRMRVTIDHRPLAGITPPMLLWWFRHIGDEIEYAGERMPGYLAWHPLDHIAWELARAWPDAELNLVGGAGHGTSHAGMAEAVVVATDRFATRM